MRAINSRASLIRSGLAAAVLLIAASASYADQVNLTAAPTQAALPDGQNIPMWGYSCGAIVSGSTDTCAALNPTAGTNWSPVVITVPYVGPSTSLTINLTNNLVFGANSVPTSLVIVGQLGAGLGATPTTTPSPVHAPQGATWPASGPPDSSSISVVVPGHGYQSIPHVTLNGGGGTGATIVATIGGPVTGINVGNRGSYNGPAANQLVPTISFDPAGAAASAIMEVNAVTINGNNRYSAGTPTLAFAAPACPVAGAPCVQATATANMILTGAARRVGSITITNRGAGYTVRPTITVTCGAGCASSVALTPSTSSLRVNSAFLTAGGSYSATPTVTFSTDTTRATGTPAMDFSVTNLVVTSGGSGYTAPLTVSIAPPGCVINGTTCVQATATISQSLDALASAGSATNTPPSQGPRVQSFATEVAATGATLAPMQVASGSPLTWSNLKPGTYLIESGTHPSIQGPMGLFGMLVVTAAPNASTPGTAYGSGASAVTYDAEVPLLLSEIDPVQNVAVDTAVHATGFSEANVWSGQPGMCGDLPPSPTATAAANTCYPPAVNYDPRYYLVNGVSFDRTKLTASTFAAVNPATSPAATPKVLVRLVNAGLRMHIPSIVGAQTDGGTPGMSLIAEDGNVLPGTPKVQSDVFMAAGKTYDVLINAAATGASALPVYDRQLSLSTNNQRDGGMQAYISDGSITSVPAVASNVASNTLNVVAPNTFYCTAGVPLSVTDPALGVLGKSSNAYGATLSAPWAGTGTLVLNPNGTFTLTPASPSDSACGGSFSFNVNGGNTTTATITQCTSSVSACWGGNPTAVNDTYSSDVSVKIHVAPPGVLANDTDPKGLPLTAQLVGGTTNADGSKTISVTGGSLTLFPDGSLDATTSAASVNFDYNAVNSQKASSGSPASVTLNFKAASNIVVQVVDINTGAAITDYRWVLEEDRTFYVDPKCQVNSTDPSVRPASCPLLDPTHPVQALGYNFHTAYMPIVATGCVGAVSCEKGQTLLTQVAACDIGNGACRTDAAQKVALDPGQVYLDPAKRYYLSILPGDGVNPTLAGSGGPVQVNPNCDATTTDCAMRAFTIADCTSFVAGEGDCGHAMGGTQISGDLVAKNQKTVRIALERTPLPTSKIAAFVFADDNPLNGENDAGGAASPNPPGLATGEPGLGGFNLEIFDQAGGLGDATGQITYDMFNQPVSNALAGTVDPFTHNDACPITIRGDGLVGMIPTCPDYESDGVTESPLRGQAIIANLYPGLYEIVARPGADRIARGEEWLQTNSLDGGPAHETFIKPDEPSYFQEFGPGNFHVTIGFANPKIINDRRTNSAHTGLCDPAPAGGGVSCNANLYGQVSNARMSRTPDQRIWDSGDYTAYGFTQCYVGLSAPDNADFALAKCDANGKFEFHNIPAALVGDAQNGDFKITIFDQWNDIMLDGLVLPVHISTAGPGSSADNRIMFPVTQWRTNMYTRTFMDVGDASGGAGDGVSQDDEPGLPLVATNIRYRDGSFGFFNNTDMDGFAGFNEVFPFVNWLVVETDTTRFKQTGEHVVYDAGGPAAGTPNGGTGNIALGLANTIETVPLPTPLRVPGARYCQNADCPSTDPLTGGSTGRVDPPQPWGATEGWQGLLGQSSFIEFGMRPFAEGENGGIKGHVIYASTRPFDDPTLLLQLSWEPGVPRVKINLYQEGTAPDGSTSLKLVDSTTTSSWDDWAQGFRADNATPNMNCPGQDPNSPFFATLQNSRQYLDPSQRALPNNAQFKCYDGWSMMNQVQPAPYDGMYKFPSITAIDSAGRAASSNCHMHTDAEPWGCVPNPDATDPFRGPVPANGANPALPGTPMLPAGKYVVEVIVPPGMELVKEEDKNILLGDIYIAPVTTQFAGFGNIFIMPDQAAVGSYYNKNNTLNMTTNLGATPRHEGDTGSVESFWPCVGAMRTVPDYNSLYPTAGQNSPFAGATRPLCDRKEVTLEDQATALAKFYVFTSTHVAGHFTGVMTNDFASEFDPFSPQFGEKFAPPNLPVGIRTFTGKEIGRVWSDQWGNYDGLNYSTYGVNPPNPTGYVPQMMIMCMDDPGPIARTNADGLYVNAANVPVATADLAEQITDPAYSAAYSNFCYETPFMPGFTAYMDTPVIPTQGFADGYNLPDSEYPEMTPAISTVVSTGTSAFAGPWVSGTLASPVASVTVNNRGNYTVAPLVPTVTFAGTGGAAATALMGVNAVSVNASNRYATGTPTVTFANPPCTINGTTCVRATGTVTMTGSGATRRVSTVNVSTANMGSGYTSLPTITVTCGGCTGVVALTPTTTSLRVNSVLVTAGGSYATAPGVTFGAGSTTATGTAVLGTPVVTAAAGSRLTITSLGDKVVQNPNYSGPGATTAPYNQKAITRHYRFGGATGTVTIGGVNAPIVSWGTDQIVVTVPAGVPSCTIQQRGQTVAACGELEITAANGKKSIDAVTVTIGGKAPTLLAPGQTIQSAIDAATPGDLVVVPAGTYKENVIMWKPVRLQGVGAAAVTINADAHPVGKMDPWRRQVACLFGLQLNGVPNDPAGGASGNTAFDPTGTYTCPASMYLRSDRIPFEAIVGWDATGNGNLAQLLQEPTLMGAYEGAGITVLGRGIRIPTNSSDFWGLQGGAVAGAFPDGSVYLTNGSAQGSTDCTSRPTATDGRDYGTTNFLCNPSRIDGLSIINSSQGGGAIFIHGWNHYLEVGNTRISANHGTLTGGINVGTGETPPAYINDGTICGPGVATPAPLCPPLAGTPTNGAIPFALETHVRVHHNMIINNASVGDALFSGTPSGAGAITLSAGADDYQVDHNWIAGNLSTSDGGGMVHSGLIFRGKINNNWILFNQSTNPTLPTNGGGLGIIGANGTRTLPDGTECGTTTDYDCPPGLGDGTGPGLVIDSNLILGNSAESGSGGGLRIQQANGTEVSSFLTNSARWYDVTVRNNIIVNNVAGWDGAGVSLEDALKVTAINNTIASNDTTASAGVLFKTIGAIDASSPPPGCNPVTDPTQPQDPNCLLHNAAHIPQPAGLVTMRNTPNLISGMVGATCPSGYGYTSNNCRTVSLPILTNDMFWQNRAFYVAITGTGTGLQSQQNLVSLLPQLNQSATGECAAGASYWDVGVRGDTGPTNHSGGATLTVSNSILSYAATGAVNGTGNRLPTTSPVLGQYCNGSRTPPENGGHGFLVPPGRSETTGLSTLFVFNNITPAATVDEGNNWINLSYGPLTLFNNAGQSMLAAASTGAISGAYSIGSASNAVDGGTNTGAPALDYFGNPRPVGTSADIGAVEFQPANVAGQALVSVSPSPLAFGAILTGSNATRTLVVANNGGANETTLTIAVGAAPFTRPAGPAGGTCGTLLNAGATCTIVVQYTAGAAGTSATGSVTITGAPNAVISGAPVALSGNAVAQVISASAGPNPLPLGSWRVGTNSSVQTLTVLNTGNVGLTGLTYTYGGGSALFSTPTGGSTCGSTLAVGASCTINVVFAAPSPAATYTRTLTVNGTGLTPVVVNLTGTSVVPVAKVSPSSLAFGLNVINSTRTLTLTVTNGSAVPLTNLTYPITGGTGYSRPNGTAGGTCGSTLGVDASCTINVRFAPTVVQSYNGRTLTITATGTSMTSVPVALTGSGVASPITPALLTITLGTGVNTGTGVVTFTNDLSTGPIGIGTISFTGGSAGTWFFSNAGAATDHCTGQTLAAGANCTVTVRFTNVSSTRGPNRNGTIRFNGITGATTTLQTGNLRGIATP